jgi:uncharacterized protein YbjQ (UPF0145 family)
MRVSTTATIEGSEVLYTIGTIRAASSWHGQGSQPQGSEWQKKLIADLACKAEDLYADALINVTYQPDQIACLDEGFAVKRQRMIATAVAVKLVSQHSAEGEARRERSAA